MLSTQQLNFQEQAVRLRRKETLKQNGIKGKLSEHRSAITKIYIMQIRTYHSQTKGWFVK